MIFIVNFSHPFYLLQQFEKDNKKIIFYSFIKLSFDKIRIKAKIKKTVKFFYFFIFKNRFKKRLLEQNFLF